MRPLTATTTLLASLLALLALAGAASAASHREAPLIAMDPEADITDFFMFRSYEPGQADKVDLIMDVIPGEEPSSGPNYYNFDPNVDYVFNVDNNGGGVANDVKFRFSFTNEFRGTAKAAGLFLPYVGAAGSPLPPITSLESPASMLTADGKDAQHTASPKLGAYAETDRPTITVLGTGGDGPDGHGPMVQVQRLANPLVNEAIIGTVDKDHWNAVDPQDE